VTLFLAVAALGPSVMQPALPGRGGEPPYSLSAGPDPGLVIALTASGILLAVAGLALCLYAGARGWRPRPRALLLGGLLAAAGFAMLPPIGSADHLNYAAYGRMAVTGHDPYATAARDLPGDPIARAVEPPWQEEPSIYGPIATAEQAFASLIGGESVRLTIFVLSAINLLVFAAVGLLLHRAARGDPARQSRAVLLWTANPLVLFHLVAGGHNDTLAIALAVAATLVFAPRAPLPGRPPSTIPALSRVAAAGALAGAGAAVKLQAVLAAVGPGWVVLPAALRRLPVLRSLPRSEPSAPQSESQSEPRSVSGSGLGPPKPPSKEPPRPPPKPPPKPPAKAASSKAASSLWSVAPLAALLAGLLAVAAPAYALAGPHAFDQVSRSSDAVSLATPWQLVRRLLGDALGVSQWRTIIQLGALAAMLTLLLLLLRALPTAWPGPASGLAGGPGFDAARASAAAALAWLLTAPYSLPWYDGLGWALIALLPWSRFDWLLLARTAALSLAYLPARAPEALAPLGMPADLGWLVTVVRAQVIPWLLTGILLAAVVACLRRPRHRSRPRPAPAPVRSPPA